MKLITIFSAICFCTPVLITAQNTTAASNPQTNTYIHCTEFYVSKPMRDLPDYKPAPGTVPHEATDRKRRAVHPTFSVPQNLQNDYSDPVRQTNIGAVLGTDVPIVNFDGANTSADFPGDPNGAVSPNYYVEAINVSYTVFNKTGGTVMATKNLGSLWSGDPQDGDPVVLYDKFADKWLISEFQLTTSPYQLCVAISKTNDPTGAYYVWKFSVGSNTPDYPKYAIWNNGYYITFQYFDAASNPFHPQEMAWLDRGRMLEGSPSAGMVLAQMPATPSFMGDNNSLFSAPKVFDCDASALPPYGTPDYVVFFQNIASGGFSNSIIMDSLIVDTTAKTFRIAKADSFAVSTFNSYFTGGNLADISQPGDLNGVDALDGTFNFRVPYLVFSGYNSVVMSNTVNLGGLVAGIRWYELRQTAGVWSVYQTGTYGPSDGISRWNGAICEDYDGDIALQYTASSSSVYPGVRYTGRLAADPLGQMTFREQTAVAGTGSLTNTGGRWGDYSQLDIDPSDGITFWGINQYGTSSSTTDQYNRIFSFQLFGLSEGINEVQNPTELKAYQNGSFLEVKATGLPTNDELMVDLFDISGRQLATQKVAPANNMFETQINVSSLAKGIYFVRIAKTNFQRVIKTEIN